MENIVKVGRAIRRGRALATVLGAGLALAVLSGAGASAQSNAPYRPGGVSAGVSGGVGISLGYRQAILNDRLSNSRPDALVRGADGALVDVDRRSGQAFLRVPGDGAFQPGARPNRSWPTGLGTGLGWGGAYQPGSSGRYFGSGGAGDSLTNWIAALPTGEDGMSRDGLYLGSATTPMDVWIRQLELI